MAEESDAEQGAVRDYLNPKMQHTPKKKSSDERVTRSKAKNVAERRKCTKTRNWKHNWIKIRAKRKKNLHLH